MTKPKKPNKIETPMQPWQVMTNPHHLRRMGKLGEETNELAGVTARSIIQGLHGTNPKTKQTNLQALQDEIADVLAQIECCVNELHLDTHHINQRKETKIQQMHQWEETLTQCNNPQEQIKFADYCKQTRHNTTPRITQTQLAQQQASPNHTSAASKKAPTSQQSKQSTKSTKHSTN